MAWFGKRALLGRAVIAGCLLCVGLTAAGVEDAEVDRLFNRHSEGRWLLLAEQWEAAHAAMKAPVENLMLPLDYHPNGRMRAVLRATQAQLLSDGLIVAVGVSVEMLTDSGAPDGTLTAEGCLFDRKAKHGYCAGLVSLVKGTDRLKGRGLYFSTEEQFIKILSECEIRTQRIPVRLGRLS